MVNWTQNGNNIQFYLFAANQNVIFQLTYTTTCGSITKQFKWQSSNCTGGGGGCLAFTVSPNPSTGMVNVIVPNIPAPCYLSQTTNLPNNKDLNIAAINVYNLTGNVVKQIRLKATKQSSLDLSGLINGSYYLEIISTKDYHEKHLIILQKQ